MIQIQIPKKFCSEIQYTFEILLGEFLGIPHTFNISDIGHNFLLRMESGKNLTIFNSFFCNYTEPHGYMTPQALPSIPINWTDSTLELAQLPVLFGNPIVQINDLEINLEADIIASSYFMLSRWEEIIDDHRDQHDRSTASQSIAFKFNFLHRPIVNEYADLLWLLLLKAGYVGKRKKHEYQYVVTHDMDQPYQWPDWKTSFKHLAGDLMVRKDLTMFTQDLSSLYKTKIQGTQDPFDRHQYLLDLADRQGYKAYFNLIVSRRSKYDFSLSIKDPRLKSIIQTIESNGHTIGYHPGYAVHLDAKIFQGELDQLQSLVQQKISTGRQHYLRFKVPYTWRLWDHAGMEWESSMGYTQMPGFRCGTCYTYTVFDSLERKKLKIKEKPLLLMDATLVYYLKDWNRTELYAMKLSCKKHGGEWVTILHNDLVQHERLNDFEDLILN